MFQEGREFAPQQKPEIHSVENLVQRGLDNARASKYVEDEQSIVNIWEEADQK